MLISGVRTGFPDRPEEGEEGLDPGLQEGRQQCEEGRRESSEGEGGGREPGKES